MRGNAVLDEKEQAGAGFREIKGTNSHKRLNAQADRQALLQSWRTMTGGRKTSTGVRSRARELEVPFPRCFSLSHHSSTTQLTSKPRSISISLYQHS